jgi:hypothetical protein
MAWYTRSHSRHVIPHQSITSKAHFGISHISRIHYKSSAKNASQIPGQRWKGSSHGCPATRSSLVSGVPCLPSTQAGLIQGTTGRKCYRLDRVAREQRTAREWSDKWSRLVDPVMFGEATHDHNPEGFSGGGTSQASRGGGPTKWSNYSLINPPGAHVRVDEALVDVGKITGPRHDYLPRARGARTSPNSVAAQEASQREAMAATASVLHVPVSKTSAQALSDMHQKGPQGIYYYPPTSGMETGWNWKQSAAARELVERQQRLDGALARRKQAPSLEASARTPDVPARH